MSLRVVPARTAIVALAASAAAMLLALLMGVAVTVAGRAATATLLVLTAAAVWDFAASRAAWRRSAPTMTRRLPAAFAIGVKRPVQIAIDTTGATTWRCTLYDYADSSLLTEGLPV